MSTGQDDLAAAWWRAGLRATLPTTSVPSPASGQFGYGHLNRRVFWNDIFWVDLSGTPRFPVDMSPRYRTSVIDFLYREAAGWWRDEPARLAIEAAVLVFSDADQDQTMQVIDRLDALVTMGPGN